MQNVGSDFQINMLKSCDKITTFAIIMGKSEKYGILFVCLGNE